MTITLSETPKRVLVLALLSGFACAGKFPWASPAGMVPYQHQHVKTVNVSYRRTTSQVLVRRIDRPTRAHLDWAAYHANFMIADPNPEGAAPQGKPVIGSVPFKGVFEPGSLTGSITGTSLTPAERQRPLAFVPLVDYVVSKNQPAAAGLEDVAAAVREESWGLRGGPAFVPQSAVDVLVHDTGAGAAELWVKIEMAPWFQGFSAATDEDGDGFSEFYGRVRADLVKPELLDLIRGDYSSKDLGAPELKLWANQLSSLWYPSYNTDLVRGAVAWPDAETEAEIKAELGASVRFDSPTIVMRGKPQGKATYNVFLIEGVAANPRTTDKTSDSGSAPAATHKTSANPDLVAQAIRRELKELGGGSWAAWETATAPFKKSVQGRLKSVPAKIMGIPGLDGFLFFRKALNMVVAGDLEKQPKGKNPVPAIVEFKDVLATQGIDLLFVPVPTKVEILPDKLDLRHKDFVGKVVNPFSRKFLLDLSEAGVEVVDLWPPFLRARADDTAAKEPLYQKQDTHWTDRGLQLAAGAVASRIRRYPWWPSGGGKPISYTIKEAPFTRYGDIHSRLADGSKRAYKPESLVGRQVVRPDGVLYEDDPDSPVVVLGDSYTGVYELIDCQHAGVSAHLARALGRPVDLVMSYGGGPNVRQTLMRAGPEVLGKKRLVIWMMTARDLNDFQDGWEPLRK